MYYILKHFPLAGPVLWDQTSDPLKALKLQLEYTLRSRENHAGKYNFTIVKEVMNNPLDQEVDIEFLEETLRALDGVETGEEAYATIAGLQRKAISDLVDQLNELT